MSSKVIYIKQSENCDVMGERGSIWPHEVQIGVVNLLIKLLVRQMQNVKRRMVTIIQDFEGFWTLIQVPLDDTFLGEYAGLVKRCLPSDGLAQGVHLMRDEQAENLLVPHCRAVMKGCSTTYKVCEGEIGAMVDTLPDDVQVADGASNHD